MSDSSIRARLDDTSGDAADGREPRATNRPAASRADNARVHRLGAIAFGGIAAFALVVVAMHVLEPDFDPADRFVSEYVLGDWGLLMNAAFVGLGIGTVALGLGLERVLAPSRRLRAIRNLYVFSGVGDIVSGVFNSDELVDGEVVETTVHGAIHDLAGVVTFLTMTMATFMLRKAFLATPGWEHRAPLAPIVGLTAIVGLVGTASPTDWFGIAQRAFLVVIVVWLGAQAHWLRSSQPVPTRQN